MSNTYALPTIEFVARRRVTPATGLDAICLTFINPLASN